MTANARMYNRLPSELIESSLTHRLARPRRGCGIGVGKGDGWVLGNAVESLSRDSGVLRVARCDFGQISEAVTGIGKGISGQAGNSRG